MPQDVEVIQFLEENEALLLSDSPWPSVTDDDQLSAIDYNVMFPPKAGQSFNGSDDRLGEELLAESLPQELLDLASDLLSQGGDWGSSSISSGSTSIIP